MKPLPELNTEQLEEWKQAFCSGEKRALHKIFEHCFEEIYASILLGNPDNMAGELWLLEYEILENSTEFCESDLTVHKFLRKCWQERTDNERIKKSHELFDNTAKEDAKVIFGEKQNSLSTKLPHAYRYFLENLSPLSRLYYEIRAANQLENRNGVYLVMYFMANAASFGNDQLRTLLKKEEVIGEPIIPKYLLNEAIHAFTALQPKAPRESLTELLSALYKKELHKKYEFKKICQRIRVDTIRARSKYQKISIKCSFLSELESLIFLLNYYSPIDDPIELWLQLNIISRDDKSLTKEMNSHELWNGDFQQITKVSRRKELHKKYYISSKVHQAIKIRIEKIQEDIASKLNETILWKTN